MSGTSLRAKPRVMEKIMDYFRRLQANGGRVGTIARGIHLNYDSKCNFNCCHCFTDSPRLGRASGGPRLSREELKRLFDRADEMGVYEVDVQGGEPLLYDNLEDIIAVIDPDRFYVYITSNGYLLDEAAAERLAGMGISRVSVSIDDVDPLKNDEFRGVKGSFDRALAALGHVRRAGLEATINFTVGHYNAAGPDLPELCRLATENQCRIAFNYATPSGLWRGKLDVMMTPEDDERVSALRLSHPNLLMRDIWDLSDRGQQRNSGCPAVNRCYINPMGDVLPCPFLHMKIGNIREKPLDEILAYGFSVKFFRDFSSKCLAGEDPDFVSRYMSREGMSVMNPVAVSDIFEPGDFLD